MQQLTFTNVVFENINFNDYPKFVDANIVSADLNGVSLTELEIDNLNENQEIVNELLELHLQNYNPLCAAEYSGIK